MYGKAENGDERETLLYNSSVLLKQGCERFWQEVRNDWDYCITTKAFFAVKLVVTAETPL